MYVYLYDNFLRQRKFQSTVKAMETRLTDFGVAGKIIRLQNFSDSQALIEDEIRKGAKAIVIVGNDITFGHVLSRAASSEVLFGFLPVGGPNQIAEVLGIPVGPEACDVLSRRRKVKLDVGWFNNRYFVSQLHIPPSDIKVIYDEKFQVSSSGKMELVVCNLQPFVWQEKKESLPRCVIHPQDGKLEAFLRPVVDKHLWKVKYEEPSIFPFEEMIVWADKPFAVEADGKQSKETKIKIKLARKRIDMIVGRERKF
ncbi:MAG TPA: diacylglycerol kinase family protein [Patescibacteria group bacterium]|nr:diacylglycerol kinase family protein [Patescibacteria group bacterium]